LAPKHTIHGGDGGVVLGNLLVDDMVFPTSARAWPSRVARRSTPGREHLGLAASVASVRGDDHPASAIDALTARGVDLSRARPLRA
jgi:hypothetical protein